MTCPKCGDNKADHYPGEGETYWCVTCGRNFFIMGTEAILCDPPIANDGGFLVPERIARYLDEMMAIRSEVNC